MVGVLLPAGRRLPLAPTNAIVHNPKEAVADERAAEVAAAASAHTAASSDAATAAPHQALRAYFIGIVATASSDAA